MWTETVRPQYARKSLPYSSDVTDAEWLVISPHLPRRKRFGRPPKNRAEKHRRCVSPNGQEKLSVVIAATRVSTVYDRAELFLCLARQRHSGAD